MTDLNPYYQVKLALLRCKTYFLNNPYDIIQKAYWIKEKKIEMLWKSEYIDEQKYKALDRKCSTIRFLLVKSITTAKDNLKAKNNK